MHATTSTNPRRRPVALAAATNAAAAVLVAGLLVFGAAAQADDGVILFKDRVPEASELADILFPAAAPDPAPVVRTRGLAPGGGPTVRGIRPLAWQERAAWEEAQAQAQAQREERAQEPAAFGFNVHFAFDSVEVLPESRPYLDRVGEMLKMEQSRGRSILIAGHTDAAGPAVYNQWLSERRADAVKRYLEDRHGIDPARLAIAGHGEEQPLPGTSPEDWTNRRVEFHAAAS